MGDAGATQKPLKIAIVGGGIGGLSLLLGILNHCDPTVIQPHLYEAAYAFSEIGAGVGFLPNAVRAMRAVDPKLYEAYTRIADEAPRATVNGQKKFEFSRAMMGMDGRGGTNTLKALDHICTIYNDNRYRHVHRAVFLDEMINLLPNGFEGGLVSFNKRCTDVKIQEDGVTALFADGTSENVDAVIGCDGVKSLVRNVLHGGQEQCEPQFTGKYAYRGLVPIEDAVKVLGEKALNQMMTLGYGGHLITFPVDRGQTLNIVAFRSASDWNHGSSWVVPATVDEVLEDFKEWSEPIKKLLALLQKPDKWGQFDLPPLKTYVKDGRVALLGDCAHAATPHQGAGAGMAIEDAAVLGRLLGEITTPDPAQLIRAFVAYDTVRRERTRKLVTTSRSRGLLYEFQFPDIGDNDVMIRDAMVRQWDWIWDLDVDAHCREAISLMHQPPSVVNGFQ
ncbi:hypothetical protein H2200_009819 [Cladophialophora chaetospira]|uniref:FAD-binding domain-containing protein n=1 Tax=Cladophialophora chaetospira TaxID=386627 RepID=A0AA38X381_9EURO|nr:hypothetical protein H2200_009819 [Cladophialophora chaetospira]